jgi:hypothetical protein
MNMSESGNYPVDMTSPDGSKTVAVQNATEEQARLARGWLHESVEPPPVEPPVEPVTTEDEPLP